MRIAPALVGLAVTGCGAGSMLVGTPTSGDTGGGGGPVSAVSFFVQPNSASAGQVISPAIEVLATDSAGAPDSAFTGTISVAIGSNAAGGALGGTTNMRSVNGIATFDDLSIDKAGTYTLIASTSGATAATSGTFTITSPGGGP